MIIKNNVLPVSTVATGMDELSTNVWLEACDGKSLVDLELTVHNFREWDFEIAVWRVPAEERLEYREGVYSVLKRYGIDEKYYCVFHMHHGADPEFDEMAASVGFDRESEEEREIE